MRNWLVLLGALSVLGNVQAGDLEGKTVAVLDFGAVNTSAGDAGVISNFVRQAVVRSGSYVVVDKKNMDKVLAEQAFQQTGCTSSECAVKLGKVLNVKKIIVGEYSVVMDVRWLTGQLVDVETSKIEAVSKVRGFTGANVDEAANQLVGQLMGKTTKDSFEAPKDEDKALYKGSVAIFGGVWSFLGGGGIEINYRHISLGAGGGYVGSAGPAGAVGISCGFSDYGKSRFYISAKVGYLSESVIKVFSPTVGYCWSFRNVMLSLGVGCTVVTNRGSNGGGFPAIDLFVSIPLISY